MDWTATSVFLFRNNIHVFTLKVKNEINVLVLIFRRRYMNQSGGAGGSSRTGTITSTYRSGAAAANGASAFDTLNTTATTLEKRSLALNSAAADGDLTSYDVFEAQQQMQQAAAVAQQQQLLLQQQQQGQLGGHLSPGSQMTFADLHDVHYAPSTNPNGGYDNNGYRPSTRQSNRSQQDLHMQQQQPVSLHLQADSVADMKRELKQRLEVESSSPEETNTTTSETGSGSEPNAAATAAPAAGGEYQTMERSSLYESSSFRPAEGRRALPTTPPAAAAAAEPAQNTIPSVPGYAKPYARPFQPPPDPPASKPPRSFNYAPEARDHNDPDHRRPLLLETSLDDDTLTRRQKQPVRSRSVGQILEVRNAASGSGCSRYGESSLTFLISDKLGRRRRSGRRRRRRRRQRWQRRQRLQ